jgi:hypothetical protein
MAAGFRLAIGALCLFGGGARAVAAPAPAPLFAAAVLRAHPGPAATALVRISGQGEVSITLRHDAIAFALDEAPQRIADAPMLELLAGSDEVVERALEDARERFETLCELDADGVRVPVEVVTAPTAAEVRAWQASHRAKPLPVKLDLVARAKLPRAARSLSLRFPEVLGALLVTIDRPGVEPLGLPLSAGERLSGLELELEAPDSIGPHGSASGAAVARGSDALSAESAITDSQTLAAQPPAREPGALAIAGRYLALGFTHIVPLGLDHVLFVLGLFLLSRTTRELLLQITAFTIAHSITLALSMFDLVSLPAGVVEPAIAASIAFVAFENVATASVRRWRPLVVFGFGLVHGLGQHRIRLV